MHYKYNRKRRKIRRRSSLRLRSRCGSELDSWHWASLAWALPHWVLWASGRRGLWPWASGRRGSEIQQRGREEEERGKEGEAREKRRREEKWPEKKKEEEEMAGEKKWLAHGWVWVGDWVLKVKD
jgi:hypothetical protein